MVQIGRIYNNKYAAINYADSTYRVAGFTQKARIKDRLSEKYSETLAK